MLSSQITETEQLRTSEVGVDEKERRSKNVETYGDGTLSFDTRRTGTRCHGSLLRN